MKKQIYILKDVESGSFDDVTTDNFYLLVDDIVVSPESIPLTGTEAGKPVTGDIQFEDGSGISLSDNVDVNSKIFWDSVNERTVLRTAEEGFNFYFTKILESDVYSVPTTDNTYVQKKYVDEAIAGAGVINIKATLAGATYTLQNSDVNFVIPTTNVATVITVDDDSITRIGDVIYIDYQGDGTCEIKQGTATLNINENDTLFLDGKYSRVAIQKMSATNYRVFGQLIPE